MKSLVLALSAFSLLAASGPSLASPACQQGRKVHQVPAEAPRGEDVPRFQGSFHEVQMIPGRPATPAAGCAGVGGRRLFRAAGSIS